LAPRHSSYALSSLIIFDICRNEGEPSFLILQSCIFYPICRCQRTLFRLLREKGLGLSFQALTKHQNGVFCFHIATMLLSGFCASCQTQHRSLGPGKGLGLTGLEPVTLRLSSACSNQLSYRPGVRSQHARVCPPSFKTPGAFGGQTWLLPTFPGWQTKHPLD
jgi:hypothetical protein